MRNSRRGRLVLTILLLAAFTLITLDYRSNSLGGVRNVMSDVFGPIEDGISDVTHPVGSWFSSIGHLGTYKNKNNKLKAQVAQLESQLHLTAAERAELGHDQRLLKIAGLAQFTIVGARVTAYGRTLGFENTVTINRGSANGIKVKETVIDGNGLVGRTVVVSRHSSTVLLANDRTFTVGARLEAKQLEIGSVAGGGINQPLSLSLLGNAIPLTVGEQLVTEGDSNDSPFVPEVPIGTITHIDSLDGGTTETATVAPYVDFTALDVVAVVVGAPPSIPHDALLPHKPSPTPTVTVTVTAPAGTSSPGAGSTGSPGAGTSTSPTP